MSKCQNRKMDESVCMQKCRAQEYERQPYCTSFFISRDPIRMKSLQSLFFFFKFKQLIITNSLHSTWKITSNLAIDFDFFDPLLPWQIPSLITISMKYFAIICYFFLIIKQKIFSIIYSMFLNHLLELEDLWWSTSIYTLTAGVIHRFMIKQVLDGS